MNRTVESFKNDKAHLIIHQSIKEENGNKIDTNCCKNDDFKIGTLEWMCDVIHTHKGKTEEKKNIKNKVHPENVIKKGCSKIDKNVQQKMKQETATSLKHFIMDKRDKNKDRRKIDSNKNEKSNTVISDEGQYDTIFILEMEEPKFGPTVFKGDGEITISEFLKDYEHFMAIQYIDLDDRQMGLCVRNFLQDRAKDVYDQIENRDNYNEVKATLLNKFQNERLREKAELKIVNVYQSEDESVLQFANRLTKLVRQATEGQSEGHFQEKLNHEFCKRISPNYRYLVNGHRPKNFEEAFEKAELYEHELAKSQNEREKDMTHVLEMQQQASSNKQKRSKSRNTARRRRRICYRCRQPGHEVKDCRLDNNEVVAIQNQRRQRQQHQHQHQHQQGYQFQMKQTPPWY